MKTQFLKYAFVLGLITAIGPFAIDMYLPALPSIKQSLGASIGAVQMSLMVFFIALGICQLVYGPVSDMVGRRAPLYFGLGLFIVGSVGCALAPDINSLIAFRFLQGVGACAGMVITRAIVRDMHTGAEAVRLMSLLMLVFSTSPILAPLAGSFVIAWASWRMIFWVVIGAAVVALVLLTLFLPETRPRQDRVDSSMRSALAAYRELIVDPMFLGLTLIGAFGISSFFAYLANSSFVLIEHYGLTPTQYSLCFSINAVAFFGAAQANGALAKRFGMHHVVRLATWGYAASMLTLVALTLLGVDRLDVMIALLFVGYAFLGLVIPNSSVLALEQHGKIAGTASALMGTLQFMTGAAVMAITGAFHDSTSRTMVLAIGCCALISFVLAQITLSRRTMLAAEAAE
jgi:DHA1 family bicyclomycin/chloramphenicol resistance-like MFS transporter